MAFESVDGKSKGNGEHRVNNFSIEGFIERFGQLVRAFKDYDEIAGFLCLTLLCHGTLTTLASVCSLTGKSLTTWDGAWAEMTFNAISTIISLALWGNGMIRQVRGISVSQG